MKTKSLLSRILPLVALVGFAVLTVSAFAQAAAPTSAAAGIAPSSVVTWLTPVLVPLVIAGLKKVLPSLPGFTLPIIAPLLGVAIDFINSLATAHSTNFLVAALLGLAGVGLREVKDQLHQTVSPTTAPAGAP